MALGADDEQEINAAIGNWRQGDVTLDADLEMMHLADLQRPHSSVSEHAATDSAEIPAGPTVVLEPVAGLVVLTQTCDIVRDCRDRPFVEVASLISVSDEELALIKRQYRTNRAYIPATAANHLVADLDRTMTIEKAILASWSRTPGFETDSEARQFTAAIVRSSGRYAFPDDFVHAVRRLQKRIQEKHNRQSPEGAHLRALREIRVRAAPSWNDETVDVSFLFLKDRDPEGCPAEWAGLSEQWLQLVDGGGRFHIEPPIVANWRTSRAATISKVICSISIASLMREPVSSGCSYRPTVTGA